MSGAPQLTIAQETEQLQARMAELQAKQQDITENAKKAAQWDTVPPNPLKKGKAVAWELPPAVPAFRNAGVVPLPQATTKEKGGGKGSYKDKAPTMMENLTRVMQETGTLEAYSEITVQWW